MTMQVEYSSSGWSIPDFAQRNRVLCVLVLVHLALGLALGQMLDTEFHSSTVSSLMLVLGTMLPIFLILLMLGRFLHLALVVRPKQPTQQMLKDFRTVFLDADRVASGLLAVLAFSVFISTFSYFKSVIPEIQPFAWDMQFAELDRLLHFGYDSYVPVMALLGTPTIVTVVNGFYHVWMFLICMSVLLAAFAKRDEVLRNSYLIGFVLVWFIGGNVLATLFSSAGPVYFERLGLGDDFVPLTQMLKQFHEISPVWALNVHEMLWEGYVAEGKARGISAMPSMHVGSSALVMFYAYGWKRWAGHLMAVFVGIIMIGSVMLAWHYAVDAYLGLIVAWACWKSAGRIAAWDAARRSL